jgi:hypothetical protein
MLFVSIFVKTNLLVRYIYEKNPSVLTISQVYVKEVQASR